MILQHKDLIIEIQRTWNVKAKVISVRERVTAVISESLRQHVSNITGKNYIKEVHTTAVLGVARLIPKMLM